MLHSIISTKSGITEPRQLAGKRLACPEYQMTAPVWIRGICPTTMA